MEKEIVLGDSRQNIILKFERDGLWVAGTHEGKEIPHRMVPWDRFDGCRRDAKLRAAPTFYQSLQKERRWESQWPDMRSYMDAIYHYFPREQFRVEGRVMNNRIVDDESEEHLILVYHARFIVWDFGSLINTDDVAHQVAFRRFEENVDKIRGRVRIVQEASLWKKLRIRLRNLI